MDALKENSSSLAQEQAELNDALDRRSDAAKQAQRVAARLASQLDHLNFAQQQLPAKRAEAEREIDQETQSVRARRAPAARAPPRGLTCAARPPRRPPAHAQLATLERAIAEQQAASERRGVELAKGKSMYRKWLGLTFEHGDDRLRLDLTNIDPSEPARRFWFEVHVDANNAYHVEKCEPALAGLPALVSRLNETNNFAEFVRTVRRKFQETVPGREGAPPTLTQP